METTLIIATLISGVITAIGGILVFVLTITTWPKS